MTTKHRYLSITLFIMVILSLTTYSFADTKILPPSDDTYVYKDNSIFGMEDMLRTYHSTAGSQYRRITFLKFDISSLPPFIADVNLRLYCNGISAGGDNAHEFDLYPVGNNTWAEDGITFSTYKDIVGADITSPLLGSYTIPAGEAFDAQYIEFQSNNLTQMIADSLAEGKQFISFRLREKYVVKNNGNGVIVEFHSKENASGNIPQLVVSEKNVENLKLNDLLVNGSTIDNFAENTYRYTVNLAWNETSIPQITATAKYATSTIRIEQAKSLSNTTSERTAKVWVNNGIDSLSYSVLFELLPPPTEARLSDILVDSVSLEFFNKDTTAYTMYLPYTATRVPHVTVRSYDPNAKVQISNASEISATATAAKRTCNISVTSADHSVTKTYRVTFVQLPELDIILAIGQSNMAGRAPYDSYKEPMNDVYLLTPNGEMEISSNPMNKYSNIRKDLSVQGLGPSYNCAITLQKHLQKPIGFVVNALGGSSITTWYQPGKSNYDASLKRAKDAQRFGNIKAIIWHQGSSDNTAGLKDNFVSYKTSLTAMVQNFRNDLNEPNLFFVLRELSERPVFDSFSETVVQKVADYIDNADYITTDSTSLMADSTHFDTPSVLLLGERYAQKIIQHLYSKTSETNNAKTNSVKITHTNSGINIYNTDETAQCQLYDISGQLLQEKSIPPRTTSNITTQKGIYVLHIIQPTNTQSIKLLIY